MDKNEAKLKRLLSLMDDDALTKEDFVKNFEVVLEFARKTRDFTEAEIENIKNAVDAVLSEIKSNTTSETAQIKAQLTKRLNTEIAKFNEETSKKWAIIQEKVDMLRDGIDADEEVIVDKVLARLPENKIELETPEQLRDKLETLEGDERLDKSAIKGLDEAFNNVIQSIPRNGGGSGGVEVFDSTGKVGSGSALKFIGSGVSSVSSDGHTSTITIAGGSGGAVDSVNGQTGVVVLDADDIDDTTTTQKFVTATDITNLATLTNDSMADSLHRHSELSASDGSPNPALSVDASGNVGIGTTSPTQALSVSGNGYFSGNVGIGTNTVSTANLSVVGNTSGVQFVARAAGSAGLSILGWSATDVNLDPVVASSKLRFGRDTSLAQTTFESGNVGIGTAAPGALLDIAATNNVTAFRMVNTAGTDVINALPGGGGDGLVRISDSAGTNKVYLYSAGSSFFNGGNLGIGVTSPTAYLHLKAGTATASTAPIKLTAGTLNTTPESGTIEFDGTDFYLTI